MPEDCRSGSGWIVKEGEINRTVHIVARIAGEISFASYGGVIELTGCFCIDSSQLADRCCVGDADVSGTSDMSPELVARLATVSEYQRRSN